MRNLGPLFSELFDDNLILKTDSYKLTHWKQYRSGTEKIVSYMESRVGARFPGTVFFGLQPYLFLLEGQVISRRQIEAAAFFAKLHFGSDKIFNKEGWLRLLEKHEGRLPIKIKAVQEGTFVETGNVLMMIENTDPEFFWLTNYLETLLMKVWYTSTVATNSFFCKKAINNALKASTDNQEYLKFAVHDFGARGGSSEETIGLGGMAHLINFFGTDNIKAVIDANKYYNPEITNMSESDFEKIFKMYAFTICASEHSIATPFGDGDGEYEYIKQMLSAYPDLPFSMVIDSFDAEGFPEKLFQFKATIDEKTGKVVLRPDSGNPVEMVIKILHLLWSYFGGTYKNGYKILHHNIGILQGDGIDYNTICEITKAMIENKFAPENVVYGSGGGLLQKFDRDTQRFAIKCCAATINGKFVSVSKNPKTDPSKASKSGELKLLCNASGAGNPVHFSTISSEKMSKEQFDGYQDCLNVVFNNGKILKTYSFDEVRERVQTFL